ncbi:MAG: carbohydrate-binding family V/XII [Polyangiaceae bacterium]|jgi:hypothetical protein
MPEGTGGNEANSPAQRWVLMTLVAASACSPAADPTRVLAGEDAVPSSELMVDDHVATDNGWPRVIRAGNLQVKVYQPQVETWDNDKIRSRAAVSVQTPASAVPVYGVTWLSARTDVDRENRLVTLNDIRVESGSFPSQPDRAEEFTAAIRQHMATGPVYVALDRLQASLAVTRAESKRPTVHVRNDVPRILLSTTPAILVLIDGQPVLRPVTDTGLLRIINTRALLLFDPRGGHYYLSLAGHWMTSGDPAGPWVEARDLHPSTAVALDRAKEVASRGQVVDLLDTAGTPLTDELARGVTPTIYVSTVPAELVQLQGPPQLQAISGTHLLEVTNSTSDLFVDTVAPLYYVLLSGRWYSSPSLERGPWAFVPAKNLPSDFAQIPENHPKGIVLASVAGTPEAQQAVIANEIPQTVTVDRRAAELTVSYDGAPKWAPIEGTSLAYALNSATPAIRVAPTSYYAVDNGIWFTAESPLGPWIGASSVPDVIYTIPPSSPLYYVTYVRVYDSTPDVVHEGYTPGYLGSYVGDDDVVVYGTGFVYPCWADNVWIGSPWTFGFDVGWAPGFYWGFGWGYGVGLAVGFWPGMLFHPWWGPAGWGWGHRNVVVRNYQETNLYRSSWGRNVVGNAWERNAASNRAAMPVGKVPTFGGVYAGHDGQVYRTAPGAGWERNTGETWQRTEPTRDLGREDMGRQVGGAHWQTFRSGGGFQGGAFHGGGRRR